jgi:hypothetical protein
VITFFILILLYPENPLVLPHRFNTLEACNTAAASPAYNVEKYACVKIEISQ